MAKNFAKKYGVGAEGAKVKATAQLEMVIREARANNIQGDVSIISDAPAAMAQLIPMGFVESWLPPDLAGNIPPEYQDPLTVVTSANVWAYNTELFDKCPVSNIWELTDPKWKGKVAMQDPLGKASYVDWFNQMAKHGDGEVKAAYKALYGKDLETAESSATAALGQGTCRQRAAADRCRCSGGGSRWHAARSSPSWASSARRSFAIMPTRA